MSPLVTAGWLLVNAIIVINVAIKEAASQAYPASEAKRDQATIAWAWVAAATAGNVVIGANWFWGV